MAFKVALDSTNRGERFRLQVDKQTGKPVYLFVQIVDEPTVRQLRKEHARGLRAEKVGKQQASEMVERGIATSRAYARRALVDSEGFGVEMGTQATADAFAEALGAPVNAGEVVVLDGRWNDTVKDLVFRSIPQLVEWINKKADSIRGFEAEEEDEAAESFR